MTIDELENSVKETARLAACCGCDYDRCDLCHREERFEGYIKEAFAKYKNEMKFSFGGN